MRDKTRERLQESSLSPATKKDLSGVEEIMKECRISEPKPLAAKGG